MDKHSGKAANKDTSPTTEVVSDRVLHLVAKDFRKFVKVFTYLKIRTDMRAMEAIVQQHRQ